MEVMGGGGKAPLSVAKLCEMEVLLGTDLDICRSLHLSIGYLLKDKHGDLESKFHG